MALVLHWISVIFFTRLGFTEMSRRANILDRGFGIWGSHSLRTYYPLRKKKFIAVTYKPAALHAGWRYDTFSDPTSTCSLRK
jgi:hypothetical protein